MFPWLTAKLKIRHYENFQLWLSGFWVSAAYFLPKVPSKLTQVWFNQVSVPWQKNLLWCTLTHQGNAVSLKLLSCGSSAGWKSFSQNVIIPASTLSLALQGILANYTQQTLTEGNTNRMGCQYLEDVTRMKDQVEKLKKLFEMHEII